MFGIVNSTIISNLKEVYSNKVKEDEILEEMLSSKYINISPPNLLKLNLLKNKKSLWETILEVKNQKQLSKQTEKKLSSFISRLEKLRISELIFSKKIDLIIEMFFKEELSPDNIKNINHFKSIMTRFDNVETEVVINKFNEEMKIIEERNYFDENANIVTLSTIHAAKGLEFKYVFIIGFEDEIIPSRKKDSNLEEEKRLLYVAISRAKQSVYLLKTKHRNKEKAKTSPFEEKILSNIDEIIDPVIKKVEKKSQMKMFG